jgi:hypothetical protein
MIILLNRPLVLGDHPIFLTLFSLYFALIVKFYSPNKGIFKIKKYNILLYWLLCCNFPTLGPKY